FGHLEDALGPEMKPTDYGYSYSNRKEFNEYRAAVGPLAKAFARAEYEETQDWFKMHGITHVTVVRGMTFNQDENPYPDATLVPAEVEVQLQPQSSYSMQLVTA